MSAGHGWDRIASTIPEGLYEKARMLVERATVNRQYDVETTANRSVDGNVVYIDDTVPIILPRTLLNTGDTLPWHELSEWFLMNEGYVYDDPGMPPEQCAHPIANAIEKMRVEELGGDWNAYTAEFDGIIETVDDKEIVNPPPDQDQRVLDGDADDVAAQTGGSEMTTEAQARSWFAIRAATDTAPAEISIYDEIGFWGITAADFSKSLKALGDVKTIDLRVNSPGGDVFDGIAIHNLLASHPAKITAHIDGIAASAASLIVMAADEIVAPENAFMLIHDPRAVTIGTAEDHATMAADLQRMTDAFAKVYADRTKQTVEAVKALMKEDRLMPMAEAKDKGYVNTVEPNKQMSASFDLSRLGKHKEAVAKVFVTETKQDDKETAAAAAAAAAKEAAASKQDPLTEAEKAEVMELCAIAGVSSRVAFQFVTDNVKPDAVRTQLVSAAAAAADNAGIQRHDPTRATEASTEAQLAERRKAQDLVRAEMGLKPRSK